MATDLPAHAFGHAFAVTGDAERALAPAVAAAVKGGRSLVAVLAHARHQALLVAEEPGEPSSDPVADLAEVALALAGTRPPKERAILDLDTRHGLDRAGLGRTLGLPATAAASRANAIADLWAAELDPALVVWLGPGDCQEMAAILPQRQAGPDPSPAEALSVAGAISAHEQECEACADRRRARVSVRSLLANSPLPSAPAPVVVASAAARRWSVAPPPPIETARRPVAPRLVLAAAAVAVVLSGAAVARALTSGPGDSNNLDALTQVRPAGSTLALSPATIDPSTSTLRLENTSGRQVRWSVHADVDWLDLSPRSGLLRPGKQTVITVRMSGHAPEGGLRASITASGSDGSTAGASYTGTLERPPEVSAAQKDCQVTATAEDDGRVDSVTLRWSGAISGQQPMTLSGDVWMGALPAADSALDWWVEAIDDRGNPSRSDTHTLEPSTCPAP